MSYHMAIIFLISHIFMINDNFVSIHHKNLHTLAPEILTFFPIREHGHFDIKYETNL